MEKTSLNFSLALLFSLFSCRERETMIFWWRKVESQEKGPWTPKCYKNALWKWDCVVNSHVSGVCTLWELKPAVQGRTMALQIKPRPTLGCSPSAPREAGDSEGLRDFSALEGLTTGCWMGRELLLCGWANILPASRCRTCGNSNF